MADISVVDLSHYQNVTNYAALRGSIGGAYIKVSQGTGSVDPMWSKHWDGLKGVKRAPYHFLGQPTNFQQQVANFRTQYERVSWEWGPVLDAEALSSTGKSIACQGSWIKQWVAEWRRQTGKRLIYVYVGKADLVGSAAPSTWVDSDIRIIAARYYSNKADWSTLGFSHPQLDGYQFYDKGSKPGISGLVDLNIFHQIITSSGTATATAAAAVQEDDMQLTDTWDEKAINAKPNTVGWALLNIKQNVAADRAIDTENQRRITAQSGAITALANLVAKGNTAGLTAQQVTDAVNAGIKDAVVNVDVNVAGGGSSGAA